MSLVIGQLLKDRYRIQSILGEGGMGTVYLAQDLLFDRPRAIKELYPDPVASEAKLAAARTQFEREAQALSKLRHKNLPHVSDYFSIDENDYLVMDYIEGESLADILGRKKRPTEQLLHKWLKQILDALDYCHQSHVIHRDIKPANIILTREGKVMLVDFGLVKFFDPHNPSTATIVRGLGTPEYTPLEQYDASMGHTDARSDIYGLGATLYHLLTGRPPQPVSQRILKPDTQPAIKELNPKVSFWMAGFVRRAMAVRPEDRFQSVTEMRQTLDTRLYKLRQQSRVDATTQRTRQSMQQQYRHQAQKRIKPGPTAGQAKTPKARKEGEAPDLLPALLPMLVPITVVMLLTMVATLIVSAGPIVTVVVATPLVLGALLYHKITSGGQRKPPRP